MQLFSKRLLAWVAVSLFYGVLFAEPPKLVRSLSGPSGKTVGSDFVIDESRNRFVYPNDNALVVYFEWEAPPGDHALTAAWKEPDGRVISISPDVKVQTMTPVLKGYWSFVLYPGLQNGVWTVEIRVDGQPAGSHSFEIAGMAPPLPPAPKQLTVDDIFRTVSPSIVSIKKLNGTGIVIDSSLGFVIEPNTIATAFQAIDGAVQLEIVFSNGRTVKLGDVLQLSRTADWTLLRVDTGNTP